LGGEGAAGVAGVEMVPTGAGRVMSARVDWIPATRRSAAVNFMAVSSFRIGLGGSTRSEAEST
jgi:hypothetical protein